MSCGKTESIRELNDALRSNLEGGNVFTTASVSALPPETMYAAIDRMRTYDAFTNDNDPYGEHDFGSFDLDGRRFFWKIDYYDKDMRYGSNDPADPTVTTRVLTLMLAADY